MKHLYSIIAILAVCLIAILSASPFCFPDEPIEQNYVPNEVLVRFHDWVDESQKEALRTKFDGVLVKVIKSIKVEYWKLPNDISTKDVLSSLQKDPLVEYAEPNFLYKLQTVPDDTFFDNQWALSNQGQNINGFDGTAGADIQATDAWRIFTGTEGIIVAVIDSGCALNHIDLADAIWINQFEANGTTGIDDDKNGYIDDFFGWNFMNDFPGFQVSSDYYHGSHVAGIIAATTNNREGIAGICKNVKLMTLRVNNGRAFDSLAVLDAFDYARLNGAKIVNCSFGGYNYSQFQYDAILSLNQSGILVIAAAGNGGDDQKGDDNNIIPFYPSDYDLPNIISVAATDNNDKLAVFSNYGLHSVDVGAPGKDIYSTIPSNDLIYYEDMEGLVDDWTPYGTGPWYTEYNWFYNTVETIFRFSNNTPGFSYIDSYIQKNNPINLSGKYGNKLYFRARWNLPADAYFMVGASTNPSDPSSWQLIDFAYGPSWVTRSSISIPLDKFGFSNIPNLYFFFGVYYPHTPAGTHWVAVDDIAVTSFANFTEPGNEYIYSSGTSMAAPVVSGVASLVWSQNPLLTHLKVKDIILNSVDQLPSLNGKVLSGGRVNVYNALLSALESVPSPPNSDAGQDQSVTEKEVVTLNGAGSTDSDGTIRSYSWTQTSGLPIVTLSRNTAMRPTFTAPNVSETIFLSFTLIVTDDDGLTDSDTVNITIDDDGITLPENTAPIANAGTNQSVTEGNTVTLDGTASRDSDGSVTTYTWTQTDSSGTTIILSSTSASKPTFTAPDIENTLTLTFSLTVTDDQGLTSASDPVSITVNPQSADDINDSSGGGGGCFISAAMD